MKTIHELCRLLPACAIAAAMFASGCYDDYDTGADPAYYPPPSFVATAQPVYYEGHAAYWYGGRWVYRDGGRWGAYRSEPAYLAQRRRAVTAPRRVYERRPAARAPARPGRR